MGSLAWLGHLTLFNIGVQVLIQDKGEVLSLFQFILHFSRDILLRNLDLVVVQINMNEKSNTLISGGQFQSLSRVNVGVSYSLLSTLGSYCGLHDGASLSISASSVSEWLTAAQT